MLSHYFIALGSLRQQKATETKKSVLIGSHRAPPPASIVGSTGTGMLYPVNWLAGNAAYLASTKLAGEA
jgi:hypothetical protein